MSDLERQAIEALGEIMAEIEVLTQARANQAGAEMLVYRWNEATAPYVHRTEHEHHRMAQLARAIKARLGRMGARLTETESGRMRLA